MTEKGIWLAIFSPRATNGECKAEPVKEERPMGLARIEPTYLSFLWGCSFPFVTLLTANQMISIPNIQLGENRGPLEEIESQSHQQQG